MTSTERRTRQRDAIAAHLAANPYFQTAQQIHQSLSQSTTPVSLPTVYRTLAAMAQAGELDVLAADGVAAYRRCSAKHHHHLVCRTCGRTIEVTGAPVEKWAATLAKAHGFTATTHVTEITGLCPDCQ